MSALGTPGPGEAVDRFARSAARWDHAPVEGLDWLAERAAAHPFRVERVPFAELDGWSFDPGSGDLGHRSGRFFTVRGWDAKVEPVDGPPRAWGQPILDQPEHAILGVLVAEVDGVLRFLMQAKMEPGNCNLLQLSPTVQATPSNYRKVHAGAAVKYVDHFLEVGPGALLADSLQSEHGSWFAGKHNRNMIVEVDPDIPVLDDFRWFTLGEIGDLLRLDNVVNMDSRTVLSCAPVPAIKGDALHTDLELMSWLTGLRARRTLTAGPVPLGALTDWVRTPARLHHVEDRYFDVVGVAVQAGSREVTRWSQPLLAPHGTGINAFLATEFDGVPHVLVQAKVECGLADEVELAPTVQATPEHHTPGAAPAFLDEVLSAAPSRLRFDVLLSEEGGRFLDAVSRYVVVDVDPFPAPDRFRWATTAQLSELVRRGRCVNVQARTLLTCLATEPAR